MGFSSHQAIKPSLFFRIWVFHPSWVTTLATRSSALCVLTSNIWTTGPGIASKFFAIAPFGEVGFNSDNNCKQDNTKSGDQNEWIHGWSQKSGNGQVWQWNSIEFREPNFQTGAHWSTEIYAIRNILSISYAWQFLMIHGKNHDFNAKCREADICNELWNLQSLWRLSSLDWNGHHPSQPFCFDYIVGHNHHRGHRGRRYWHGIPATCAPTCEGTRYQKHLVGWESSWPVQQCENNNISNNVRQLNMKTTRIMIEKCMCLEGVYQIITPTSVKMSVQHSTSWGRSSGMLADFMSLTDLWTGNMKGALFGSCSGPRIARWSYRKLFKILRPKNDHEQQATVSIA